MRAEEAAASPVAPARVRVRGRGRVRVRVRGRGRGRARARVRVRARVRCVGLGLGVELPGVRGEALGESLGLSAMHAVRTAPVPTRASHLHRFAQHELGLTVGDVHVPGWLGLR